MRRAVVTGVRDDEESRAAPAPGAYVVCARLQMLKYLRQFGQCDKGPLPLFPDNCAGRTEDALESGGVDLRLPPPANASPPPFPASLLLALQMRALTRGAEEAYIPRGSPTIPDYSDFERL